MTKKDRLVRGVLFVTFGTFSLSELASGPLAPFIRSSLQLSEAQVGIVSGAIMAGALVTVLPAGILFDVLDSRFALGSIMIGSGLGFLAVGVQSSFLGLVAALFVVGLIRSGVAPLVNKVIAFRYDRTQRGTAMGVIQAGSPIAGILGAVILPALAEASGWNAGYRLLGLASITTGLICWAFLPSRKNGVRQRSRRRYGLRQYLRTSLAFGASFGLYSSSMHAVRAFLSLYLVDVVKVSPLVAGLFFGVVQGAAVGGRIFWGVLADRRFVNNRPGLLSLNAWVTVFSFALLSLLSYESATGIIILAMVALGLGVFSSFSVYSALLADVAGERAIAGATALALVFMWTGGVLGPPAFGGLVQITSSYTLALGVFAAIAAFTAFVFPRISFERKIGL